MLQLFSRVRACCQLLKGDAALTEWRCAHTFPKVAPADQNKTSTTQGGTVVSVDLPPVVPVPDKSEVNDTANLWYF
jgi:hypothetical protein